VRRERVRHLALKVARRVDASRRRSRVRRFRRRVRWLARWRAAHAEVEVAPGADIARSVSLEVWQGTTTRIVIGAGTRLGEGVKLSLRGGSMEVGANTDVRRYGTYHIGGEIRVGSGCVLSTGIHLHCAERVTIGDLTIIGEYTTIADSRHLRTAADQPVHHSTASAPIAIGRNIWMGAHAVIASGVTVGDMAFVAAGAVVTKDVAEGWLVGGVPARPLRLMDVEDE
jgi:acetyltransferase-like isoleucine patch superfamily enzyme